MAHFSYTGVGDRGTTCLLGKSGLAKDDARIEALGCYDELDSALGVAAAFSESEDTRRILKSLQDDMHTICAELGAAIKGGPKVTEEHVKVTESLINEYENFVEPQQQNRCYYFVLPGETKEAALLHLARTIARRSERRLVAFSKTTEVNPMLLKYANRLSSLLYIMARAENKRHNIQEKKPVYKFWKKEYSDAIVENQNSICCGEEKADKTCGCLQQPEA